MPKGTNQKLKLYYLAQIMVNNTDDEHAMTLQDIKNALEYYEITADRKSLYDDLNVLRDMGLDVLGEQRGRSYYYHVGKVRSISSNSTLLLMPRKILVCLVERKKMCVCNFLMTWLEW